MCSEVSAEKQRMPEIGRFFGIVIKIFPTTTILRISMLLMAMMRLSSTLKPY